MNKERRRSLVRVSLQARRNDSIEYQTAVNEFVEKMGGATNVLKAIRSYKPGDDDDMIISFHRDPVIARSRRTEVETLRCM